MNATAELLSVSEVASKYRVLPVTVVKLAQAGKFRAFRIGHLWRIDRASFEAYIESTATQSATK